MMNKGSLMTGSLQGAELISLMVFLRKEIKLVTK
jgi:hypothetical protein